MCIQIAQEEINKHILYKELKEKEASLISEKFIRGVISKIEEGLEALSAEIAHLTATQATAKRTIEEYENKSAVAKLFSGKTNVIQAEVKLEKTNAQIEEVTQKIQRQQNLKQEYLVRLDSFLLLQEQIKLVVPEKTQEFWNE